MRHMFVAASLAVCLCTGSALADLQTTALDAVEAEVIVRDDALTGDLDKSQKKLKRIYATVLKKLGKDSTSLKKDAKYVKVRKEFRGRRPRTVLSLTKLGRKALSSYRDAMQAALGGLPQKR